MLNGKTQSHRLARWMLATLAVTAAMACGGSGGEKSAGDDGAQAPAASATTQSQPAAAASPTIAPAAPSSLVLVASNILFDGAVTIDVDNQDSGVPHNVHVFDGADATAASLGATALESGPIKQSLRLDLANGQYFYQCDVHPTTMTGTITVG